MQIKGYVHTSEDEAFLANVYIVQDERFYDGDYVGYIDLGHGNTCVVKEHPSGGYFGLIFKEAE